MSKRKAKPSVTPIITGIHAPQREKKLLALHYHPEAIKSNIKELKEMAEEQPIKDLFEDIGVLVEWALQRLPLVAPPKEKEADAPEETPTSQNEAKK